MTKTKKKARSLENKRLKTDLTAVVHLAECFQCFVWLPEQQQQTKKRKRERKRLFLPPIPKLDVLRSQHESLSYASIPDQQPNLFSSGITLCFL